MILSSTLRARRGSSSSRSSSSRSSSVCCCCRRRCRRQQDVSAMRRQEGEVRCAEGCVSEEDDEETITAFFLIRGSTSVPKGNRKGRLTVPEAVPRGKLLGIICG
jgi:hypothetical protein